MVSYLEDTVDDVMRKAARGLGITPEGLSQRTGISRVIEQAVGGNEKALRAVAPILNLHPEALIELASNAWQPLKRQIPGVKCFTTPYNDVTVNSWLIWDAASGSAAAFDTGSDATPLFNFLKSEKLVLRDLFLTHTHGDHIFEMDRISETCHVDVWVGEGEPIAGALTFAPGTTFSLGSLEIEARLTCGHSAGGITYVIHGLTTPVAIVGDALFAGSMGGPKVSYWDAIRTNRQHIFSLPKEAVLCPGHGPSTTVGEELKHNPFFATDEARNARVPHCLNSSQNG